MKYLNALNTIPGVGAGALRILLGKFQTGEKIWEASVKELSAAGISENLAQKIGAARLELDPEQKWQELVAENVQAILFSDSAYPSLLREIHNPPCILYLKGNKECLKMPMVAVVGSRKFTTYGKQAAYSFAKRLAEAGVCVVSGLALGIDAIAHQGALDGKGKTIAVLGNSLDDKNIHPRNNFSLSQDILTKGGLLISEFPIETSATPGTFPARNRIMAGISEGTLVIEAAEKSGTLITANLAVDFNRDVFVVPGSIFSPQSEGCHQLIKKGAKLVQGIQDILEEIRLKQPIKTSQSLPEIKLTDQEKQIVAILSPEPTHIDRITKLTKLETSTISSNLAMLEIKGVIKNVGAQNYIRL